MKQLKTLIRSRDALVLKHDKLAVKIMRKLCKLPLIKRSR